jgi:hypothetical protein
MIKEQGGGGGKPQRYPKATFDIVMSKYKGGRADARGVKTGPSRIPNQIV